MSDWNPVIIGILITVIIGFLGIFIPFLGIIAPIVGGLITAFMAGGDYKDGAVTGGMAGLFGGAILGGVLLGAFTAIIGGVALGSIIGLILGIIGGSVGIIIKKNDFVKGECYGKLDYSGYWFCGDNCLRNSWSSFQISRYGSDHIY